MAAVLNPHELENLSAELHELLISLQEEVCEALNDTEFVQQLLNTLPPGQSREQATLAIARRLNPESLRHQLESIERCKAALERIRQGRYGRCECCHEAIELNRLKADPLTERCLGCQE